MNKIFSAVALAATVVTLTLASADVLASSGKGKDAKSSSHNTSQSAGPGKSAGKGKGSEKSKGHDHNHSNGNGHDNHQGNGYGHDHDDEDEGDGSCVADNSGNGHNQHKGKGHQHDHIGYINGVGHHKHHDHDDEDCGGGDGDNGGGDGLPQGCYAGAAWVSLADYEAGDGFKDAIGIAVQTEGGTAYGEADFSYITDLGTFVAITPDSGYALHEYSVYVDIDGVESEIYNWLAPTQDGEAGVVGNDVNNPFAISETQFDAGIGVTTLICELGVTPGSPN